MIFMFLFTFTVGLIAVGLGVIFLVWSFRKEGQGISLARNFGYFITFLALLALLFTAIYGVMYWSQGYFKSPVAPMMMMKQQMWEHRKDRMMKDPMMKLKIERIKQRIKNMQDRQQRQNLMSPDNQ